jgi:hypothetical protein
MVFGVISPRIGLFDLLRASGCAAAMATRAFGPAWPTMWRSSSETISAVSSPLIAASR